MPAAPAPTAPAPTSSQPATASTATSGVPTPGQTVPSAPAPTTDKPAAPPINDAFADIDKLIADTQQKSPPPPGARRAQEKLQRDRDKQQPSEKPDVTDKAEGDKPATPPATDESQTLKAPELRAAYAAKKKELAEMATKLTAAETRLKELEAQIGDGSRLTKLQEQYESAEKRAKELEERIRYVDYKESPEYEEKFHKPFVNAYQAGRTKIGSLRIIERKNDADEVIQPGRKATAEDFDAIMQIPDDGQAAEVAERLFGPMSNLVIYHREKVLDLNSQRTNAIEEFRKTGTQKQQEAATQMQALQDKVKATFKQSVETGINKYPQWFKADEGDDQGKQALEKGMLNVDTIFSENKYHPEQLAQVHAAFRNMAGAFPFVALKLHRAESRLKELEGELEAFKKSEPVEASHERGEKPGTLSADEEIDSMIAGRR